MSVQLWRAVSLEIMYQTTGPGLADTLLPDDGLWRVRFLLNEYPGLLSWATEEDAGT